MARKSINSFPGSELTSFVSSYGIPHTSSGGSLPVPLGERVSAWFHDSVDNVRNSCNVGIGSRDADKAIGIPGVSEAVDALKDRVVPNSSSYYRYEPEPVVNSIEYFDAPYAEKYGMSAETAYQEALANTAHQREMADLKAAGLNPVLTAMRGSGADVFAGSALQASSGAGSYGSSHSSAKGFLSTLAGSIVTLATGKSGVGNAARNLVALFEK